MKRFLMTILAIGIVLPLCTQAAALSPDGGVAAAAPMSRAAADPCGHAQTGDQDIPAADCMAHCLSAKGFVGGQQRTVTGEEAAAARSIDGAVPAVAAADSISSVSTDDHILRMLLYNRLSGVIMRN